MSGFGGSINRNPKSVWSLDDPVAFVPDIAPMTASGSSGSKKRKNNKHRSGNDFNSQYPPAKYTHFAYEISLQWYEKKTFQYLDQNFLNANKGGEKAIAALEKEILAQCMAHPEYKDLYDEYSSTIQGWCTSTLSTCVFNTPHLMELQRRPPADGLGETYAVMQLRDKMDAWHKGIKKHSKGQIRGMGWQNDAMVAALHKHGGSAVGWVYAEATIIALSVFTHVGGQGRVRKVCIQGMPTIPSYICFAGKVPTKGTSTEKRIQRSTEALACPLNHPGVIKIWAIHAETMESYTLWWNGGCLHDMFRLNGSIPPTCDLNQIMARCEPEESKKKIYAYRKNRVKLAWALVYITSLVHDAKVLHNDLSPYNILLHFDEFDDEKVYIGICDWGVASRLHENSPSHYGYDTYEKTRENTRMRWWVAPECFYTFGPRGSETSIPNMQATHKYNVKSDSFSIGKLIQWMGVGAPDEFDKELFKDKFSQDFFLYKCKELMDEDPTIRKTCKEVVDVLMAPPWKMKSPEDVFRTQL